MTLQDIIRRGDPAANVVPRQTSRSHPLDISWVGGRPLPKPPIPDTGQVIQEPTGPPPNVALAPTVTGSAEQAWRGAAATPIRVVESAKPKQERFHALQQWEGVVDSTNGRSFVAKLVDRTADEPDEEAEFDLAEVPPGDRELVVAGAVFYWSVGYRTSATRTRSRVSIISSRRLPAWTEAEKRQARESAEKIAKALDWC
jgi:hypothetical protein